MVSPGKQKRDICIAFPVLSSATVSAAFRRKLLTSFCIFSETIRARAMKLGSCIHLEELKSTLCSIFSLDLLFMVH